MKLSSRSRYALLTVLDLSIHRESGVSKVQDIARRQSIPQKFLEQILLVLKSGGLVTSRRGAKGGYLIGKEPEEITVADVLRLTEESLLSTEFTEITELEKVFEGVWESVNAGITETLEALTFQDMLDRAEPLMGAQALQYSI